jgi:hypothetical protein
MDQAVRSIYLLTHAEIVELARRRAEAGDAMAHGFQPGSAQAVTFETHYQRRLAELQQAEV